MTLELRDSGALSHLTRVHELRQQVLNTDDPYEAYQGFCMLDGLEQTARRLHNVSQEVKTELSITQCEAARHLGRIFAGIPRKAGQRTDLMENPSGYKPLLRDLQIDTHTADDWQKFAQIPDEAFNRLVTSTRQRSGIIRRDQLLTAYREYNPPPKPPTPQERYEDDKPLNASDAKEVAKTIDKPVEDRDGVFHLPTEAPPPPTANDIVEQNEILHELLKGLATFPLPPAMLIEQLNHWDTPGINEYLEGAVEWINEFREKWNGKP